MSQTSRRAAELDDLLDRLLGDTLNEGSRTRLSNLIADDDDAARLYADRFAIHASLVIHLALRRDAQQVALPVGGAATSPGMLAARTRLQSPASSQLGFARFQWASRRPLVWSMCGVGCAFVIYVAVLTWGLRAGQRPDGSDGQLPAVAELRESGEVRWSKSNKPKVIRGMIKPGEKLALEAGVIELELKQGTTLVVEGPAEWSIDGANHATLNRGKLLAHVPKQAIGFTVVTPTARIVDLGTEFGVEVDDRGDTDLQVRRGNINIAAVIGSNAPRTVRAGERRRVALDHQSGAVAIQSAVYQPDRFVSTAAKFNKRSKSVSNNPQLKFIAYRVPAGFKANQDYSDWMVMDFGVLEPIDVLRLGAFDADRDGFDPSSEITVLIVERDDRGTPRDPADDVLGDEIAKLVFTAESAGELLEGSRFKPLDAHLRLHPGAYSIMARGFSAKNQNGNVRAGPTVWTMESGGGAIEFTGRSRYREGTEWKLPAGQFPNAFAAGTFEFCRASDLFNKSSAAK